MPDDNRGSICNCEVHNADVIAVDMRILRYMWNAGYHVSDVVEAFSIIQKEGLDMSWIKLPDRFSSFEEYVSYVSNVYKERELRNARLDVSGKNPVPFSSSRNIS